MANKDAGTIMFVKPALYLTENLHELYVLAARAEQRVYKGFNKKAKAKKAIEAFEKILNRAIEPFSEITQDTSNMKAQGKDFADSVIQLYRLFISLNESRIVVLREFQQNGMSPQIFALNEKSLSICREYDALFPWVKQQAESLYNIFSTLRVFEMHGIDI